MSQHLERLQYLAPTLQDAALAFLQAAKRDLALTLCVVFTYRSALEQMRLYRQGRAYQNGIWVTVGETVTNASGGTSPHNVVRSGDGAPASVAMDLVPMDVTGALLWSTPQAVWQSLWTLAWKYGFDPLGDKVGAYLDYDKGHFEEPGWKYKLSGLGLALPAMTHDGGAIA